MGSMTPEQFCYWLQGFIEMRESDDIISCEQVKMIREHLATVFKKVTGAAKVQSFRIDDPRKKYC